MFYFAFEPRAPPKAAHYALPLREELVADLARPPQVRPRIASICSAARLPLASAPATEPSYSVSVASPARIRRSPSGRAEPADARIAVRGARERMGGVVVKVMVLHGGCDRARRLTDRRRELVDR